MRNTQDGSQVRTSVVKGFRWPDIPNEVRDLFPARTTVMLQSGRWCGLPQKTFASLVDGKLVPSSVTVTSTSQHLERDAAGRALVIGADETLYAVDETGTATALGVVAKGTRIGCACWVRDGFALVIDDDICVYRRGAPIVRFASKVRDAMIRVLPHEGDPSVDVLVALYDDACVVFAVTDVGEVRTLATLEASMADVRMFLDETGDRMLLPDGPCVNEDAQLVRFDGIADALANLAAYPQVAAATRPAPSLGAGADRPASTERAESATPVMAADAASAVSVEGSGKLTRALITMLRAGPRRAEPLADVLALIHDGMARDVRAYVQAWAVHAPSSDAVYEFWMKPPRAVTEAWIRTLAGTSVHLGIYASGEPIVARAEDGAVYVTDEEGGAKRHRDLESFLADLQFRAEESENEFELAAWVR